MSQVSVVGPTEGEVIQLGPIQMRILEDGQYHGSSPWDRRDHARPAHRRAAPAPACPARRGLLCGLRHGALHRRGHDL